MDRQRSHRRRRHDRDHRLGHQLLPQELRWGSGNPAYQNDDSTKIEPGTFPTAKVVGGYDFVGDNYDPEGPPDEQVPNPDKDPLDCKDNNSENVQAPATTSRASPPARAC